MAVEPAPLKMGMSPGRSPWSTAGVLLIDAIERYYDAAPRATARTEAIGPFTLFVETSGGGEYYARPTAGSTASTGYTAADVANVRLRQQELGVPEALEWVEDVSPGVGTAVAATGLAVHRYPLLVLDALVPHEAPEGFRVGLVDPAHDDLAALRGVAELAFTHLGTASGPQGAADVVADSSRSEATRRRIETGRTVMVGVWADGACVGVGSANPVGGVAEIVGVGVVPALRRRGVARAVVSALVAELGRRGVGGVFLSASDADVARVYEASGFRRRAVACVAEAVPQPAAVAAAPTEPVAPEVPAGRVDR